jgi:hypothetical protein
MCCKFIEKNFVIIFCTTDIIPYSNFTFAPCISLYDSSALSLYCKVHIELIHPSLNTDTKSILTLWRNLSHAPPPRLRNLNTIFRKKLIFPMALCVHQLLEAENMDDEVTEEVQFTLCTPSSKMFLHKPAMLLLKLDQNQKRHVLCFLRYSLVLNLKKGVRHLPPHSWLGTAPPFYTYACK